MNFLEITGENGHVTGLKVVSIKRFCFDDKGVCVDERIEGSERVLPADTIIFAIGQRPDLPESFGLATARGGRVAADGCKTSVEGVFAAGDAVTGTASVIRAIASARFAAEEIDRYLGGDGKIDEVLAPVEPKNPALGNQKGFGELPRAGANVVPAEKRCFCFAEMDLGLSEEEARAEASRCLQCDLRLDIAPQKFWSSFTTGGQT